MGSPEYAPEGAKALTEEPNWVRRPEEAARTEVRRTATLGAAVARTVGTEQIAAIVACNTIPPHLVACHYLLREKGSSENPSCQLSPTGEAKLKSESTRVANLNFVLLSVIN